METLVAILIIAVLAAVAFIALRRRPGGMPGVDRRHAAPVGRRGRVGRPADPMAAAVAAHAQATDPADVVAAEQRLRAEARNVAAGMNGTGVAHTGPAYAQPPPGTGYADPASDPAYAQPAPGPGYAPPPTSGGYYAPASAAASPDPNLDREFDPQTGQRVDGYDDPANDPRLHDSRYDGRLAADWVDPREDDRVR